MNDATGTLGDPVQASRDLPGVARGPLGLGPLVLRGGRIGDTKSYLDEVPIPTLFHLGALTSVIHPAILAGVDLYPGPTPPSLAGGIGGAVQARLREDRPEELEAQLDVNLGEVGAYMAGPIATVGSYMIAARRSYFEWAVPPLLKLAGLPGAISEVPEYWDTAVVARLHIDSNTLVFRGLAVSGQTNVIDASTGGVAAGLDSKTSFQRVALSWARSIGKDVNHELQLVVGTDQSALRVENGIGLHSSGILGTIREEIAFRLTPGLRLDSGLLGTVGRTTAGVHLPPESLQDLSAVPLWEDSVDVSRDITRLVTAGWIRLKWHPAAAVTIGPVVRADYDTKSTLGWIDPKVDAVWRLNGALALVCAFGLSHQWPSDYKLLPTIGNPLLKPEASLDGMFGMTWTGNSFLTLTLDVYGRSLFDLAMQTNRYDDPMKPGDGLQNKGTGRAYGAELVLKSAPLHGLTGWVSAFAGQSLERATDASRWTESPMTQRYSVSALLSYAAPYDIHLGLRARITDGNPSEPLADALFNEVAPVFSLSAATGRLPGFFLLDVKASKRWTWGRWFVEAYIEVENVTDHTNIEDVARSGSEVHPITGLPIFPAIGVKMGL